VQHERALAHDEAVYLRIVIGASTLKMIGTALSQFLLAIDRPATVMASSGLGVACNALGAWAPLGAQPTLTYTTTTGKVTSEVVLDFLWTTLGGMATPLGEVPAGFVRARPLVVVLDNASAHVSKVFKAERDHLAAADIHLFYLPTYSPHLNRIEALWRQVKYQDIPVRSYRTLDSLLAAVHTALDHYVCSPLLCHDNLRASA